MSSELDEHCVASFIGANLTAGLDDELEEDGREDLTTSGVAQLSLGLVPLPLLPDPKLLIQYLIGKNKVIWEKFLQNRFTREGAVTAAKDFNPLYGKYAKVSNGKLGSSR